MKLPNLWGRRANAVLAAAVLLGSGGGTTRGQGPVASKKSDASANAKVRAELAKSAYARALDRAEQQWLAPPAGPVATGGLSGIFDARLAETLAAWSRRRADAERDLAGGDEARAAAIRGHRDRMAALERGEFLREMVRKIGANRPGPPVTDEQVGQALSEIPDFVVVARFARLEAEAWLESEAPRRADGAARPR